MPRRQPLTPAECLRSLPEPRLDTSRALPEEELRGAELGRAVLSIAQLNHVNETAAVRDVVANVLGDVPDVWT